MTKNAKRMLMVLAAIGIGMGANMIPGVDGIWRWVIIVAAIAIMPHAVKAVTGGR